MTVADRTGVVRARGGRDAGGRGLVPTVDHGPAEICSGPAHGWGGAVGTAAPGCIAPSPSSAEADCATSDAASAAWQKGTGFCDVVTKGTTSSV